MFIKKLHVRNFKSIEDTDILFAPLSMIVGANASGKSNIINVFRFIGSIVNDGVDNAVALQGGMPNLANANMPKGTPVDIHFILDLSSEGWVRSVRNSNIGLRVQELECRFSIKPNSRGTGYRIAEDYLRLSFCYANTDEEDDENEEENREPITKDIQYSMCFHKRNEKASIQRTQDISGEDLDDEIEKALKEDIVSMFFADWANHAKGELMLSRVSVLLPSYFSGASFIRIFDFDPKELKKASSMVSTKILAENGSNIASVLQGILRSKEKRQKLQTLLKRFLPFIENVTIENNLDKSFAYKIKESYSSRAFHANFLSDGTVSILAVIIALYFEENSNIIILEEPERNIHPKLLSRILDAAEDVSQEKQVVITTHNAEFLKHAKIQNVRLVSRDKQGYTTVFSPEHSQTVQCFMSNELGLDDLFINDMLGE